MAVDKQTVQSVSGLVYQALVDSEIEASEAQVEVKLILEHVLSLTNEDMVRDSKRPVSEVELGEILAIVERRKEREPIQYCLGHAVFMGLKLAVQKGVFIPRMDSEVLVQLALEICQRFEIKKAFEIGIGSGAIAIALLSRLPSLSVVACETSRPSRQQAATNALTHAVSERLKIVDCDWIEECQKYYSFSDIDKFAMLVSNPPYIPGSDASTLAPEVLNFEPHQALFGLDEDGLGFYRAISRRARFMLEAPAIVCVEVGIRQSEPIQQIFAQDGWQLLEVHRDLAKIERALAFQAKF